MTRERALVVFVALVALGACQVTAIDEGSSAIIGGTIDLDDPAVVALSPRARSCGATPHATCTGTLIAPRAVLTAAHCVTGEAASALVVTAGPRVDEGDRTEIETIEVHPAYDGVSADLAVIELAVPHSVAPLAVRGTPIETGDVGSLVRVVGFGADDDGRSGSKRHGTSRISEVAATTFVLAPDPSLPCHGDSGGPVLLAEQIAGVVAYGDPACATSGTITRVDVHDAFIAAAVARIAASTPASRPWLGAGTLSCAGCEGTEDCPRGSECVEGSCAILGIEGEALGASCSSDATCGGSPCLAGLDEARCRCLEPCDAAGGCGCASSDAPGALLPCVMVVAMLRRRRR